MTLDVTIDLRTGVNCSAYFAGYKQTHVPPSWEIGEERDGGNEGEVFRQQFPCSLTCF